MADQPRCACNEPATVRLKIAPEIDDLKFSCVECAIAPLRMAIMHGHVLSVESAPSQWWNPPPLLVPAPPETEIAPLLESDPADADTEEIPA